MRWLLRTLVEPAFLRLYLDSRSPPPTFRAFEDAFFSLAANAERPAEDRKGAWEQLERWVDPNSTPTDWFRAILAGLRNDFTEEVGELGRFWALGELFESDVARCPDGAPHYHEIHCHLRSGVPYLAMWRGYIESDRKRVALRGRAYECKIGLWSKTWAELVRDAECSRRECHAWVSQSDPATDEAAFIRTLVQYVITAAPGSADVEHHVRYLGTCAGLSSILTYHRGEPGLAPFDRSYNRYSNAQKVRGSPGRQQTRALVASSLRRFGEEGAAAVELRPTLDRRRSDVQRKLQDVVLGYFEYLDGVPAGQTPVAMGLVTSLVKQEALHNREPSDPAFWETQAEIWAGEIRVLLSILDEIPALRWFIVGVDAAGKERGCSLRALRPAYDLVRAHNRGRSLARPGRSMSVSFLRRLLGSDKEPIEARVERAWRELNQSPISPIRLGLTVHAGEDFEDPLTGLRNIWEAAVDLHLGDGDRIGHALAAGLDKERVQTLFERRAHAPGGEVKALGPKRFALSKPRGAHLLDLAWICRAGGQDDVRDAKLRLGEVATRAFGAPADATRLAFELARQGALTRAAIAGVRYADPGGVHAHDRETVIIDETWLDITERMRRRVLHELVCRGIVVESCPTSNLVVPNLDGEPPLLALTKETRLKLALATDNPGLLGCFPRFELNRRGIDEGTRQRLLEASVQASFVTRVEDLTGA